MADNATIEGCGTALELVTFNLGSSTYGVDILSVQGIESVKVGTPGPGKEGHWQVFSGLGGDGMRILDLSQKLGLGDTQWTDNTRCIVVQADGLGTLGLIVDGMRSVTVESWRHLSASPTDDDTVSSRFVKGLLRTDEGTIVVLDVREVLRASL